MIFQFENWYAQEFEAGSIAAQVQPLNLDDLGNTRNIMSQGKESSAMSANGGERPEDTFEDEDSAVYRRAKNSVDELHRARKFEKSIKLK